MKNYTFAEIEYVLDKIKSLIKEGRISYFMKDGREREKNQKFLDTYIIDPKNRLNHILQLQAEDFSEGIETENDVLYVFRHKMMACPKSGGKSRSITIYIKFSILYKKGKEAGVVISFHEEEYPMRLYFGG